MQVPLCNLKYARIHRERLTTNTEARRVFTCHLINLYEYNLLTANAMDDVLKVLEAPIAKPEQPSPPVKAEPVS